MNVEQIFAVGVHEPARVRGDHPLGPVQQSHTPENNIPPAHQLALR